MRAKQKQGGASDVWATQGDADCQNVISPMSLTSTLRDQCVIHRRLELPTRCLHPLLLLCPRCLPYLALSWSHPITHLSLSLARLRALTPSGSSECIGIVGIRVAGTLQPTDCVSVILSITAFTLLLQWKLPPWLRSWVGIGTPGDDDSSSRAATTFAHVPGFDSCHRTKLLCLQSVAT